MKHRNPDIVYYVPKIPNIKSTSRYNHAISLAQNAEFSILITNVDPPESVGEKYDTVYVFGEVIKPRDILQHALRARAIVHETRTQRENNRVIYVTTFHYAQALSGYLTNVQWVVDIYDDPLQLSIRRSAFSPHQITSRALLRILDRADIGIVTLHPDSPRSGLGQATRFALNGSPVSSMRLSPKQSRPPLRCVWVGKTKVGWGIELLLEALSQVKSEIIVDVYGEPTSHAESLAIKLNVCDQVHFHGNVPHKQVRTAIEDAHVGLCILKSYDDFKYSFPIKIGEYLAGRAIPVVSDMPGIRMLVDNAGLYIQSNPSDLANTLDELAVLCSNEVDHLMNQSRERGEAISWKSERERFVNHIISS